MCKAIQELLTISYDCNGGPFLFIFPHISITISLDLIPENKTYKHIIVNKMAFHVTS